jgi:hypothetical protein
MPRNAGTRRMRKAVTLFGTENFVNCDGPPALSNRSLKARKISLPGSCVRWYQIENHAMFTVAAHATTVTNAYLLCHHRCLPNKSIIDDHPHQIANYYE